MTDDIPTTHRPRHLDDDVTLVFQLGAAFFGPLSCLLAFLLLVYYLDAWAWVLIGFSALAGAWRVAAKVTKRK